MSLLKSTATIGFYTIISRIFGFLRDMLTAALVGASDYSDAFLVAFKLPNFFRRIFAEGAFNSAFVPLFAGQLAAEGRESAKEFAEDVFAVLLVVLLGLTAFFILIMPLFMHVLAPGFAAHPEKFALTVELTRITFPYLLFISLVSLLGGVLNSMNKFAAVAATPILMNLCFIFALLVLVPYAQTPVHAMAYGVFLSGVAQFLWLAWFCKKSGMMPKLKRPRLTSNVKKLLWLVGPAALGASVAQINLMIDTIIGSLLPGNAVSYLYFADRVHELPLAVIGIAVGTAILPMLSKQIREGKQQEANRTMNRALELALLFAFPASAALIVIAEPMLAVLFEHGKFTADDTRACSYALMAFAAGLPAFVLVKIFAPGFYANQDTKTPFKIATFCIGLNLVLNLLLMGPLAHVGLALSTAIAGWVNSAAMQVTLRKRGLFALEDSLSARLPRIALASVGMAAVLAVTQHLLWPYFRGAHLERIFSISSLIGSGLVSYAIFLLLLRAADTTRIKELLTRKREVKIDPEQLEE